MTEKRKYGPYVWVTWIASIMAGEQSCLWRSWFMTHHQDYAKAKTDGKFTATWNIKHTSLLHKSIHWLQAKGLTVTVEDQNSFKYTKVAGICLAGKADIVATDVHSIDCMCHGTGMIERPVPYSDKRYQDHCLAKIVKRRVVYDTKSGRPKHSHHIQLMIYMHVLDCDAGYLIYEDETVEVAQPDEAVLESFDRNLKMLASDVAPFKSPSHGECRYCKLTKSDCPEKVG